MEINEQMMRDLRRKLETEKNKREIEVVDHWKKELEVIYKKKFDSLAALQLDMKSMMERMGNRISILTKMVREES